MKPIKRHESLQQLSREHHFGLLFCWKIRQGLQHGVDLERIQSYATWFWNNHLIQHFEVEENKLFPVLGTGHPKVAIALEEHRQIAAFFQNGFTNVEDLSKLEKLLNSHIRFEERDLFNEIQQTATDDVLKILEEHDHQVPADDWPDEFWAKHT